MGEYFSVVRSGGESHAGASVSLSPPPHFFLSTASLPARKARCPPLATLSPATTPAWESTLYGLSLDLGAEGIVE